MLKPYTGASEAASSLIIFTMPMAVGPFRAATLACPAAPASSWEVPAAWELSSEAWELSSLSDWLSWELSEAPLWSFPPGWRSRSRRSRRTG